MQNLSPLNYSSVEDQIKKLKAQNLIIENEAAAKNLLKLYGYSNLIKSYRDPYFIINNGQKMYRTGVSFDQIASLYLLDKNLRNAVMASMLTLEEHIKEAAANVISQSFGTDHNTYLNFRNYQNKRKRKQQFTLTEILKRMNKALNSDKDPVYHYMTKYNIVPPWILFKNLYMGTMINYIDQFKLPEKEAMVKLLYDPSKIKISLNSFPRLMLDTLFTCNDYRNTAAHGGRIYNHICKNTVGSYNGIKLNLHGFSQLLWLLSLLEYKDPYHHLEEVLDSQINRHCSLYPSDVTYLGQILNINITSKNIVFVTKQSKIFHSNPHCSGIIAPKSIELSDAQLLNLTPCKKCCVNKDITA